MFINWQTITNSDGLALTHSLSFRCIFFFWFVGFPHFNFDSCTNGISIENPAKDVIKHGTSGLCVNANEGSNGYDPYESTDAENNSGQPTPNGFDVQQMNNKNGACDDKKKKCSMWLKSKINLVV